MLSVVISEPEVRWNCKSSAHKSEHVVLGSPAVAIEGVRARARAAVRAELVAEARRQLAEVGPAALSLRSVARAVGMVSSGVYRYFASRDELLTALIVESYDALGAEVERSAARHRAKAPLDRWVATCRAARRWAVDHPHEWALVY